jgi:hypothetical protein
VFYRRNTRTNKLSAASPIPEMADDDGPIFSTESDRLARADGCQQTNSEVERTVDPYARARAIARYCEASGNDLSTFLNKHPDLIRAGGERARDSRRVSSRRVTVTESPQDRPRDRRPLHA